MSIETGRNQLKSFHNSVFRTVPDTDFRAAVNSHVCGITDGLRREIEAATGQTFSAPSLRGERVAAAIKAHDTRNPVERHLLPLLDINVGGRDAEEIRAEITTEIGFETLADVAVNEDAIDDFLEPRPKLKTMLSRAFGGEARIDPAFVAYLFVAENRNFFQRGIFPNFLAADREVQGEIGRLQVILRRINHAMQHVREVIPRLTDRERQESLRRLNENQRLIIQINSRIAELKSQNGEGRIDLPAHPVHLIFLIELAKQPPDNEASRKSALLSAALIYDDLRDTLSGERSIKAIHSRRIAEGRAVNTYRATTLAARDGGAAYTALRNLRERTPKSPLPFDEWIAKNNRLKGLFEINDPQKLAQRSGVGDTLERIAFGIARLKSAIAGEIAPEAKDLARTRAFLRTLELAYLEASIEATNLKDAELHDKTIREMWKNVEEGLSNGSRAALESVLAPPTASPTAAAAADAAAPKKKGRITGIVQEVLGSAAGAALLDGLKRFFRRGRPTP